MITVEDVKRLLFEATPGPWYPQDFTPPEVNDAPTAGDVYVSATWPDHIGVASMCGGFMGPQGLVQARADAEAIATWPKLARAYIDTAAALEKMTAERDAETARADASEAVVKGLREQGLEFPDGWRDMAHDAHNGPGLKAQRTWSAGFNAARDALDAALAQIPTDPGDGWTWNERLGWIGPDGKPAGRGE